MTNTAHHRPPPELRPVVALLLANLALSAILAVLLIILRQSVVDYQIAHLGLPPGADTEGLRTGLTAGLWSRILGVVIIAVVYTFVIRSLRRGRRRSWFRILILAVVSLLGIAYLLSSGQYPAWVLVEQAVQALVLIALLVAALRPGVRAHFAKPSVAG